jgi:signal transduction histidine kinase
MSTDDRLPVPERTQTDLSLHVERERADKVLVEELAVIDEAADAIINRARERADAVLAVARAKVDAQSGAASTAPTGEVRRQRAVADRAVSAERADADETLRFEQESHSADLSIERGATDNNLLRERQRADEALATRDEFLGIVSHDLRNMLGVIMGSARLIVDGTKAGEAEQSLLNAQRIQRAGARMNRLMGDLLDIASIEAGMLAVNREPGNPSAIVTEAIETFQSQADANGVAVAFETESPSPPALFDPARILQVLANLLSNALKFTPRGGRVVVRVQRVGADFQFSVADTGQGISGEKLEAIFERFVQISPLDRRGVGLGLYIAKCIMQGHGGRIWAESEVGKGSTFYFTIPIVVPDEVVSLRAGASA